MWYLEKQTMHKLCFTEVYGSLQVSELIASWSVGPSGKLRAVSAAEI